MKTLLILTCVASALAVSACMVREERVVQPSTAAVVAPAPAAVVYTDPAPRTTTVYTR